MNRLISSAVVVSMLATLLTLAGCGSTQVVNQDKTLVVHGDMYNVSKFDYFSSSIEGTMPNGEVVDVEQASRKEFNALLKRGKPIRVSTAFLLGEEIVVYESKDVDSYSELSGMRKRFERANGKFQKFMSRPKESQLTL